MTKAEQHECEDCGDRNEAARTWFWTDGAGTDHVTCADCTPAHVDGKAVWECKTPGSPNCAPV